MEKTSYRESRLAYDRLRRNKSRNTKTNIIYNMGMTEQLIYMVTPFFTGGVIFVRTYFSRHIFPANLARQILLLPQIGFAGTLMGPFTWALWVLLAEEIATNLVGQPPR